MNFWGYGEGSASETLEPVPISQEKISGSDCVYLKISYVPGRESILNRLVALDKFLKALLLAEGR